MFGIHYLVNYNGRLVSPNELPEYWQGIGRFFISKDEMNFSKLRLEKKSVSFIFLWNEKSETYNEILMYENYDFKMEPIKYLVCNILNFGEIKWKVNQNMKRSRWCEILPDKNVLEKLYLEKRQYFTGVNLNK